MYRKRWEGYGIGSWVFAGACLAQTAQPTGRGSGCANTPAAAIEAARAGQKASQSTGFRVESVRWDATQRQIWAVIRSCDHAERPTLAMLADLPHSIAAPASAGGPVPRQMPEAAPAKVDLSLPVVHAGEVVRLWRADSQAHIELLATAEENGTVGTKVRLRLMTAKEPDGQYAPPKYLAGVVRGPADVEMEQ